MQRLKVKELPGFVRDPVTKALINTDRSAYDAHMLKRQNIERKESEIKELRSEIEELKFLVTQLTDKING